MLPLIAPEMAIPWGTSQIVRFDRENLPTMCWADRQERGSTYTCGMLGVARLGLCLHHQRELLGD